MEVWWCFSSSRRGSDMDGDSLDGVKSHRWQEDSYPRTRSRRELGPIHRLKLKLKQEERRPDLPEKYIMGKTRAEDEEQVRSWGFKHVFTWTDRACVS